MQLGSYTVDVPIMLAPMAGMSDLPFREMCRQLGAGYAVGEMTTSKPQFRDSKKSSTRWAQEGESGLRVVQLLGADPEQMAQAAQYAQDSGADIVDINMGCPAKKVLQVACGSALMRDETLVERILHSVVKAVSIPVTLKIRTGWDRDHKNAPQIARIAEDAGIAMLTVHGRTRADAFRGEAEYDTIATVKQTVRIPVIANGDITSGTKAHEVLTKTGADGIMIGRASYGNPWIFSEIAYQLGYTRTLVRPTLAERRRVVLEHMQRHYALYGEDQGVLTIRKHLAHYLAPLNFAPDELHRLMAVRDATVQFAQVNALFDQITA